MKIKNNINSRILRKLFEVFKEFLLFFFLLLLLKNVRFLINSFQVFDQIQCFRASAFCVFHWLFFFELFETQIPLDWLFAKKHNRFLSLTKPKHNFTIAQCWFY